MTSGQNDQLELFHRERVASKLALAGDVELRKLGLRLLVDSVRHKFPYNFDWMGRPVIQYPEDLVAMQEIIWRVQPDVIVEAGIAHGGSLIFHASMLALLGGDRRVIGIDVDIRPHNRAAIESHPISRMIDLVEGSSVSPETVTTVKNLTRGRKRPLVILDSNHTHDHVQRELQLYSPLVRSGSYLVVLDTVIEDMPEDFFPDRPWG